MNVFLLLCWVALIGVSYRLALMVLNKAKLL